MLDTLLADPVRWVTGNPAAALAGIFVWGLGSALLSPCHLGIIPLLGSHAAGVGPFGNASARPLRQALLFTLGYYATIPLLGLLLAIAGQTLALGEHLNGEEGMAHFWSVPVGLVLLWFGRDMMRGHACAHGASLLGTLRRRLGLGPESGVTALGFGYGVVSAACAVGFMVPVITLALPRGVLFCTLLAAAFGLGHCLPMAVAGASAPLAARILRERAAHAHHSHDDLADPHAGEARFRRLMGIAVIGIGILFILHPFLE